MGSNSAKFSSKLHKTGLKLYPSASVAELGIERAFLDPCFLEDPAASSPGRHPLSVLGFLLVHKPAAIISSGRFLKP